MDKHTYGKGVTKNPKMFNKILDVIKDTHASLFKPLYGGFELKFPKFYVYLDLFTGNLAPQESYSLFVNKKEMKFCGDDDYTEGYDEEGLFDFDDNREGDLKKQWNRIANYFDEKRKKEISLLKEKKIEELKKTKKYVEEYFT